MTNFAISIGSALNQFLEFVGATSRMAFDFIKALRTRPLYPHLIVDQINQVGIRSLSIVCVTAISTGAVMALQFGFGMEKFGAKYYIPKIVSLSLMRELAPVFSGLMLAGRVGAGITAEIGSMKVKQQIDAIRALGTSPIKRIVVPRVLACLIALPLLTVVANFIGIIGALLICTYELGLDPLFFIEKVTYTCTIADFVVGVLKTYVFAFFISITGCYYGFRTTGGTEGVGVATTKSVVTSSILIVISDFILTKIFWILERL